MAKGRDAMEPPELRHVRLAGVLFLVVLLVGFFGYTFLTGASVIDAAYMTIITITTVGYGEVVELDAAGRVFTMGLLVAGVGAVTYGAISGVEFLVEGHLGRYIERRRMHSGSKVSTGTSSSAGTGARAGRSSDRLGRDDIPHVVVESDPAKANQLEAAGIPHLIADATEDTTLTQAGVERARAIVAAVHGDAENVMIALSARGLAPDVLILARSRTVENESKLQRAGADHVITPASIGGSRIAQLLARPTIATFLDRLGDDGTDFTLEEVAVRDELDGRSLGDIALPDRYGCTVVAIHRRDRSLEIQPGREAALHEGDTLIVIGSEIGVAALREGAAPSRQQ